MYSASSRYRRVPAITAPDAHGTLVPATDIRPLPDVTATYQHTVTAGDRLDQLAWTYYNQPLQYWRICDANPDFLSPLALLGQEPIVVTRFPVTPGTGSPPWAAARAALTALVGVEDVTVEDPPAVVVTYNRLNVTVAELTVALKGAGLTSLGSPGEVGRIGRPIVVPVAPGGHDPA
ncbi:MAG TPA: hypothetical protein VGJ41_14280 [Nocardioides sp.]|jgi:hypothetical protein